MHIFVSRNLKNSKESHTHTASVELSASMSAFNRRYSCGLLYTEPGAGLEMILGMLSSEIVPTQKIINPT
jgi:hypothetical protein